MIETQRLPDFEISMHDLAGKKVVVLGTGKSGVSAALLLKRQACDVYGEEPVAPQQVRQAVRRQAERQDQDRVQPQGRQAHSICDPGSGQAQGPTGDPTHQELGDDKPEDAERCALSADHDAQQRGGQQHRHGVVAAGF